MPIRHGGYVGEPRFDLAASPLLPQHDGAALIEPDDVHKVASKMAGQRKRPAFAGRGSAVPPGDRDARLPQTPENSSPTTASRHEAQAGVRPRASLMRFPSLSQLDGASNYPIRCRGAIRCLTQVLTLMPR
jgi:hypothetical protein